MQFTLQPIATSNEQPLLGLFGQSIIYLHKKDYWCLLPREIIGWCCVTQLVCLFYNLKRWPWKKLPKPWNAQLVEDLATRKIARSNYLSDFFASMNHPFNKAGQIPFQLLCVSLLYNWFGLICACVWTDVIKLCLKCNPKQWCTRDSDGSKYQYGAKNLHKIKKNDNRLMSSL